MCAIGGDPLSFAALVLRRSKEVAVSLPALSPGNCNQVLVTQP